jgi:N-acetylneuraminic acid mutarotase
MRKIAALLLGLIALTALCIIPTMLVSGNSAVEDFWTQKASMHQARGALGIATVNGKIYAIGGSTSTRYPLDVFVGTNEEYDVATNTWTIKVSMPTPRAYFAIAAYQNKIYCIGGAVGMAAVDERSQFTHYITSNVNEVYDTVTGTWITRAPMPEEGMQISAQEVNGKIYVIGLAQIYVYDPVSDSWTNKTSIPLPTSGSTPVSVVIDNKIIVTGKYSVGYDLQSEQQTWIYDTENESWSQGKSGPTVVGLGGVGVTDGVKAPQRVYVLGLATEQYPPPSVNEAYDPKTDTWAIATAMPTNRSDFSVVVVNDLLYAIGGYLYSSRSLTLTNVNEQYTPIGYSIPPEIEVVSPLNQTYTKSSVFLVFTVDKVINWTGYSVDGKDNVTFTGNITLTGLSNGLHNITVYAKDTFGNTGASEAVAFTLDYEPFPTVPVAAVSGVAVAVVVVGLIFYYRKRNH